MQLSLVHEDAPASADSPGQEDGLVVSVFRSQRFRSLAVIALIVVLANSTYLLHVFNPNPINQVSGLGATVQPGPLPGENNIDPNIGFTSQALGHRAAVDWLHGEIPWWNPYEGVGAPLAGEMQAAAFFPLNLFNLLPGGQVYFRLTLEVLAGFGTYLLLRRFTRSNLPAVVGGVAFALNGTFSWMFHAPGNPIAFLPFLLLGVEWAREGALNRRRKGWALIAVALALSLYAGFPEVAFIDGLLAVLWCVARALGLPRRSLASYAQSLALGAGVAVLLAAPIIVAFADYLPNADIGGHGGAFARASLGATTALPAQVMPYLFGPIFGFAGQDPTQLVGFWGNIGGYLGVSLCVLALVGVAGQRYRVLRIALALWVVVGLARLVGVSWALDIINTIPGVKSTAFYRYAPPSWELAIVVLAVFGLDDVLQRSARKSVVLGAGLAMVAICLLCWHAAQPVFDALEGVPHSHSWALASLAWALAVTLVVVVFCLLIEFRAGGSRMIRFAQIAVVTVVILDVFAMFVVPQFSAPRNSSIDTKPVNYLERHLGQNRFFTLGPLAPDYGSYFGLSSLAVNDVPVPKSFQAYVPKYLDPNVDPLVFTGSSALNPGGSTPAQEFVDHLSAYEAVGVKYILLPSGTTLPGDGATLPQVFSDATARILELPHPLPLFGSHGGACAVQPMSETAVSVKCRRPSRIEYRELSMPGWHASVDGQPVPLGRDGPIFQSVEVHAGTSNIEFGFTPPHATLALAGFIVGLGLLVVASPGIRRRRTPKGRHGRTSPS
jgi:hypothetical protein